MKAKLEKLKNVYKKYGFWGFIKKVFSYIKIHYIDRVGYFLFLNRKKNRKIISEILENTKCDRVVVWRSNFGYDVPLFQRAQHIANNLAKQGCLVIYEVTKLTDKVKTIRKHSDNLYLVNFTNKPLEKIFHEELKKCAKPKYLQIYSTEWQLTLEDVKAYINDGCKLIYEYIDDISPEITMTKEVPKNILDKYNYAMENKDVYVVVTADALKEDAIKQRGDKRLAFSTNGVDYKFFENYDENYEYEKEFQEILDKKKPIIMYYGALAKWFDYDLVKKIGKTEKYSVVLFGVKYDEAYDQNMKKEENIYFMGPRDYVVLKNYARHADVLTIPFLINDITRATSPVKIFEYMALHKPIVTTGMRECRKYKSVLIGEDHKDFIKKLDEAINKQNDKKYIELLDKEARENDWSMKAKAIVDLLKKDEK